MTPNPRWPRRTIAACPEKGVPFEAVTCGYAHTIAKTSAGKLYSWGFNAYGQLGDYSTTTRNTAVEVSSGSEKCRA